MEPEERVVSKVTGPALTKFHMHWPRTTKNVIRGLLGVCSHISDADGWDLIRSKLVEANKYRPTVNPATGADFDSFRTWAKAVKVYSETPHRKGKVPKQLARVMKARFVK